MRVLSAVVELWNWRLRCTYSLISLSSFHKVMMMIRVISIISRSPVSNAAFTSRRAIGVKRPESMTWQMTDISQSTSRLRLMFLPGSVLSFRHETPWRMTYDLWTARFELVTNNCNRIIVNYKCLQRLKLAKLSRAYSQALADDGQYTDLYPFLFNPLITSVR